MKKIILILFLVIISLNFINGETFLTQYTFGRLNNIGDIRSISMGLRGLSLYDSQNSSTINPATSTYSDDIIISLGEIISNYNINYDKFSEDFYKRNFTTPYFNIVFPSPLKNLSFSAYFNSEINSKLQLKFEQNGEKINELFQKNINKIQFATAYKVFDQLSLSIGGLYLFGNEENKYIINTEYTNSTEEDIWKYKYEGYGIKFGTLLNLDNFTFSGMFRPSFQVDINRSFDDITLESKPFDYPQNLSLGIAYSNNDNFLISGEYINENWSNLDYTSYQTFTMEDLYRYGLGIEYLLEIKKKKNYLKKKISIPIRTGFYYQKGYYNEGNEYGFSLGTSIKPFKSEKARFDLILTIGKKDMILDTNYEETFINFGISFNGRDKWYNTK